MKNLLILRHASPAPQGPDGTDFTRPLTPQGEQEARMQGGFLREAGIVPDLIAVSSALRAVTTAELLSASLGTGPPPMPDDALYNAPGDALLDYVQRLPDGADTVLVVSHMPGVAELLALLANDPADTAGVFSPAMLAAVSLGDSKRWAEVVPGCGVVEWLLPPLMGE